LVRKAASIRKSDSVASWLYGVAYRTAMNAKKIETRRHQRERQARSRSPEQPVAEAALRELQALLDEEVQRLPQKYRAPFVLCCLEGKSKAEAAQELGWKHGTVSGRLAQARQRLQQRLTRRGVTLTAALCATGIFQDSVKAAVPEAVIRAVLSFAAGRAGTVSASAAALAEGVLKAMLATKLKLGALLLFALGTLATGVGLAAYQVSAAKHEPQHPQTPQPVAKHTEQPRPDVDKPARTDRYGDPLPPGVLARLGTVRFRHSDQVNGIAFCPNGRSLASVSEDGTLRLWDTATGKGVRRWGNSEHPAQYFALAPDGSFLASGAGTENLRLWDTATGTERRSLSNPGYYTARVAVSPDSKIIAWSGARAATGGIGHCIALWDATTGQKSRSFEAKANSWTPPVVAFSPDCRTLAWGREDLTIQLWDVAMGTEIRRFGVQEPQKGQPNPYKCVTDLAFSPDGKILGCCGRWQDASLWDVTTGKEIGRLPGGSLGVHCLAFSPDGKLLASASSGFFNPGQIHLWNLKTLQQAGEFTIGPGTLGVAFSRDGQTLAANGGPAIHLWDVRTGKEIVPDRGHTVELSYCSVLGDQRTLITTTGDGTIRRWDLATGKELSRTALPPTSRLGMVLSPDGTIAACYRHKQVEERVLEGGLSLWDLPTQKERALPWRPNINAAIFSPDSKVLFTWGYDLKEKIGIVRSWDVATGTELRELVRGSFGSIQLSPDGKVLAGASGKEKAIFLWDAATGQELGRAALDEETAKNPGSCFLALSADSRLLAICGTNPITQPINLAPYVHIHLWDIATGKKLRQFGRCNTGYQGIAFSPDGRTLATATGGRMITAAARENRIRLWEVATGSERLALEGHAGRVTKLLFAENGRALVSAGTDTTALVWDLTGLRAQGEHSEQKRIPSDLEDLWTALADSNGTKAYQAIWQLAATPGRTVKFLREHLHPAEPADEKTLGRLVADLDGPAYPVRERATRELSKLERLAESALRKALAGQPSPELRQRIQQLLEQLETVPSAERLQALRAVEVLEIAGTPEARQLLEVLAKGAPEARLTQEAKASLERLTKQP
jgi:RNA polymerase sigma factor (sigma-70 family)